MIAKLVVKASFVIKRNNGVVDKIAPLLFLTVGNLCAKTY